MKQWGPDPDLTAIGVAQAEAVNLAWKKELAAGAPVPEVLYSSPFSRVLSTLRIAMEDILLDEPVGMRPLVLEGLRCVSHFRCGGLALMGARTGRRSACIRVRFPRTKEHLVRF